MLTFLKFKNLIFGNLTTTFLIALFTVIGFILITNADTILTTMNFETKTTIAKKLAKAEAQLKEVGTINKNLNLKIETLEKTYQNQVKAVTDDCKDKEKIKTITTTTLVKHKAANIKTKKKLEDKLILSTSLSDPPPKVNYATITLPIQEINEMSTTNISSIHDSYNELFMT